jgi:hypothetical protein
MDAPHRPLLNSRLNFESIAANRRLQRVRSTYAPILLLSLPPRRLGGCARHDDHPRWEASVRFVGMIAPKAGRPANTQWADLVDLVPTCENRINSKQNGRGDQA